MLKVSRKTSQNSSHQEAAGEQRKEKKLLEYYKLKDGLQILGSNQICDVRLQSWSKHIEGVHLIIRYSSASNSIMV